MPIVDVEMVEAPHASATAGLARLLADAIGRALQSPPGQTWVRLHLLSSEHYAENQVGSPADTLPVFVTVLQRQRSPAVDPEREIGALTQAVANATARPPACVHIEFAPDAIGRLAFGGRLVK